MSDMLLKYSGMVVKNIQEPDNQNSGGNLRKWVGYIGNDKVYVKASSTYRGGTFYECECECVACRLAGMLCIGYVVGYYLDRAVYQGREFTVCYSKDFVGDSEYKSYNSLIPDAYKYTGLEKYSRVAGYEPSLRSLIDTILLFDSIIGNSDRHLRNTGILKSKTGFISIPLFDNGNSMFYDKSCEYIKHMLKTNLLKFECKPFYSSYESQLRLCDLYAVRLNKVKRDAVYRLVNAYFTGES